VWSFRTALEVGREAALGGGEATTTGCGWGYYRTDATGTLAIEAKQLSSAGIRTMRATMSPLPRCLALVILAAGGGEQGVAQGVEPTPTSESPFSFCAHVGTDDRLGESDGAGVAALAPYLHKALHLPADALLAPNEIVWRCMDSRVYVCARGANIPCESKADRSKFNRGAANYCRENPNAADVPAYATGHNTVYFWKCAAGQAKRGQTVSATDRRGFRTDLWYLIEK
jgi:hypothetical protein